MPRFVLLEHVGHPDDPTGRHFDLLLQEREACRTWRLAEIPTAGGAPVAARELPPHRLEWLDTEGAAVSGGRGFARRVDAGSYRPHGAGADATLELDGQLLRGMLRMLPAGTGWTAVLAEP